MADETNERYLHPRKLTWILNILYPLENGETSTNHQFWGSILVLRGVDMYHINGSGLSVILEISLILVVFWMSSVEGQTTKIRKT